jgi:hypothetical protein
VSNTDTAVPDHHSTLDRLPCRDRSQAQVRLYTASETANLNGLSQMGSPVNTRSSNSRPPTQTTAVTSIRPVKATSGRCQAPTRLATSGRTMVVTRTPVGSTVRTTIDTIAIDSITIKEEFRAHW